MRNLNKKRNRLIILTILLLVVGIANYINYYTMPPMDKHILTYSPLSDKNDNNLEGNKDNSKSKTDSESESTSDIPKVDISSVDYGSNYLNYAIDSNGKLVRWNKNKITVYVSNSAYRNAIYNALSRYNTVFEGFFTFYLAQNRENSDIKIDIVDHFDSNENKDSIYMAGITNNSFSGSDKHLTNSVIQILSKKPNSNKRVTNSEVYRVALHELGHAVGIIGHSPNSKDIMYATANISDFSERDKATIKLMYSGNDEIIKKETRNFAQTKLQEAEHYAQKSPNKAISWVNLGRVYYDSDKKDKALDAYKRALSIEPNNPIIYQSMAECYYSSLKYKTAIKYYNIALEKMKTDEEKSPIYNMIGMSYAKMENFEQAYMYFKQAFEIDNNNRMLLKNYLVGCVETDRKKEAVQAINNYKAKFPNIVKEDFVKDVLDWAK